MLRFLKNTLGFLLIFIAVDYKREVKIDFFCLDNLFMVSLIIVGSAILQFKIDKK